MGKQLMIVEVSQKQAYIFASRNPTENQRRSQEIVRVTSEEYFRMACPEGYDPNVNKVYTGGGHAVLQFADKQAADAFARALTLQVLRDYPDMELFVAQWAYQSELSPGENLINLSGALEKKKSLRISSFRRKALGLELDLSQTAKQEDEHQLSRSKRFRHRAIVHIDGNAMGARVSKVYEKSGADWKRCVANLQRFSADIDEDYSWAYDAMVQSLRDHLDDEERDTVPLYKIIAAGDDLCFITSPEHALECVVSFLWHLSRRVNAADGERYSACAGIAIIGNETAFRQGYDLSEALCANAKRFAANYGGDVSAFDFQMISGVPKGSLQQIREDYQAEDGTGLLLRPFAVTGTVPEKHTYTYLKSVLRNMQEPIHVHTQRLLQMNRKAFFQGQQEVRYALHMGRGQQMVNRMVHGDSTNSDLYFTDFDGTVKSLIFDALELASFTALWEGDLDEQNMSEH